MKDRIRQRENRRLHSVYRNGSGYFDPTAGKALSHVQKEFNREAEEKRLREMRTRPLVYICSRYAGNTEENVAAARKYCSHAIALKRNPIAVHLLYPQFLNDGKPSDRELGCQLGLAILMICSEVWVFTVDNCVSDGMKAELDEARKQGKTIRWFDGKEVK